MWKIKIIYKDKSSCTLTGSHKEIPLELAVDYFNKYVANRIIYSARYQQYPKKDYSEMDLLEKIEELWEKEDIDHVGECRPDWCPLRELPEKANHPAYCDNGRFDKGWNACLDMILENALSDSVD